MFKKKKWFLIVSELSFKTLHMFSIFTNINKKAFFNAIIATFVVIAITVIGSLNLQNFDAALIIYFFGTISMTFGVVYHHSVWKQRPATQKYWKRTWEFIFSKDYPIYMKEVIRLSVRNILFQRFIMPRGRMRWLGHFLLATGCLISFGVTFGLTFGWMHFTLKAGTTDMYETHMMGITVMTFPLNTVMALILFHILVWTAIMVIIGCLIMMHRRFVDEGLIATQWFERDWLPLILLVAVSVTGLGIWFDYSYLEGKMSQFMAITHAITVAMFLMWIPFGKFFHIFQRPAQVGANIYKIEGKRRGMQTCPHTGDEYTTSMHIEDLKEITQEMGFDLENEEGKSYLDFSPEGKRAMLAKAHLKARQESGTYFG
ncbi:hypothetical protein HMPREF0204_13200 [Chryseobacterium gleum ATCC 35910]|nr:hypothetical protein [Chryseobacterium arthrosphaerae]EFK34131.1 hypothetical protein HMPREF0204_13200 [Chryseobacterium gleum ATCC 35910]